MIRAIIVDDEPLARERVKMLLARHEDVEVVGEAGDGETARQLVIELHPELVLLDVQMPGMNGMELLQSLPAERPAIVFLTAYDGYAVEAFEAAALDYVLKPVEPKRLARALDRVRGQMTRGLDETTRQALLKVLGGLGTATPTDRFLVRKSHGRRVVVKVADIEWIGAERNYIRLYTAAGSHLMRESISRIEQQLDPTRYARVHRSVIVSLESVRELATDVDGSLYVTMQSGQKLSVGDVYREEFERRIGRAL